MILKLIVFFLLLAYSSGVLSQNTSQTTARFMFYNVENLFDIFHDTLKKDTDFTPEGLMRWNASRYSRKVNSIYKVIIAAGEWTPPALVAFCEVENRNVLEKLVYQTYLSKFNYRIIHEESPDERGIDVCLIYMNNCVNVLNYEYLIPDIGNSEKFNYRSILYAKLKIFNDTLHLFVNHWPSRRGGVLSREGMRVKIAEMLKEKVDSLYNKGKFLPNIIIAGDFNCTPDDKELESLIMPENGVQRIINLTGRLPANSGTYRYKGTWEMIDQVLISEKLLNSASGIYTDHNMLSIFKPDFLLKKDPVFPGLSPFSTFRGYKYHGGYSDHLPVLLEIGIR